MYYDGLVDIQCDLDVRIELGVEPDVWYYDLNVNIAGGVLGEVESQPAGISCHAPPTNPPDCIEAFYNGTNVVLIATPAPNTHISGWIGCDADLDTHCTVVMDGDRTVTATFAAD